MPARPRPSTSSNASSPPSRGTSTDDPVAAYASDVTAGRIVAGRYVRLACQRHLDDLKHGGKRGLRFDVAAALHAIRFFAFLRHSKGEWAGRTIELAAWQQFCVGSVFGWKRADGTRRFRSIYEEIPRKNGKSTLLSGIGLYGLTADGEPGAEIYSAATKRDQARIIFDEAARMVRKSPALGSRVAVFKRNLSVDATASKFEPLSADERTADGLNPHFALVDELHKHSSRGMLDVLDTALGARRQPLVWIITTAGDDPQSVCGQEHDYAVKVLEGVIADDSLFAYIATIDEGDRWDDPTAWAKANPNLGVSVKLDDLKRQALKASKSPAALASFKRLRLNVWTEAVGKAINMDVWRANTLGALDRETLKGRRCFLGIDLSSKQDLSATVLIFPPEAEGERWKLLCRFYLPEAKLAEKADRDRAPYQQWVEQGWIETTPGNVIDHAVILERILEDREDYDIVKAPFDPWNATQFAIGLREHGIDAVEFVQGLRSYNAPTKEFLALLEAEKIEHGGNPVLAWMASNLTLSTDKNENAMPNKQKSTGRIDGISAAIMALGAAMDGEAPRDAQVVETEHALVIG